MKIFKSTLALVFALSVCFVSCKPKDADVKANVETKLKENPDASGIMVSVADGVATLTGEVKDAATQASAVASAKSAKGVKDVMDNITVAAPMQAPVIAMDDPLTQSVKDATKDYPGVSATVTDGVITLNGTIEKAKLPKLMMALNEIHPKSIDNKLTVK